MKYIILLLLLFTKNVYAKSINLDDVKEYEDVNYIEITSLNNINKIYTLTSLEEVMIKNITLEDISFLNSLQKLKKVNIYYSKVNIKKLNNKSIKELNIISSYVIDNDFTSINNLNIEKLDLEGSYIKSISSLSNTMSIKELNLSSVTNLKSLDPIIKLPNLKILDVGGVEELIDDNIFTYIKNNNITGNNYNESNYMYLNGTKYNEKLHEIIDSLNLSNLSDIEKIRAITLYVTDNLIYEDACNTELGCKSEISFNRVAKSLSGYGVCYHYALLTNKLLNLAGFDSYIVTGYTTSGLGHAWINLYLDEKWYAIDPTWIDNYSINLREQLRNTGTCKYFMTPLVENSSFYKDHLEDVLPMNIVELKENDEKEENNEIIYKNNKVYETFYLLAIVSIGGFILYLAYKKIKFT